MQIQDFQLLKVLKKGRWLFLLMLAFLALSIWSESKSGTRLYNFEDTARFQKILQEKQEQSEIILNKVLKESHIFRQDSLLSKLTAEYSDLSDKGFSLIIYKNDSLIFWSDNDFPVPMLRTEFPVRDLVGIANSYFLKTEKREGNFDAIGLILIKKEYPYENRFLKNGFQKDFRIDTEVLIQPKRDEHSENAVYNLDGNFLFTLDYNIARKQNPFEKKLSVLLYVLVFVLFLFFLRRFIQNAGEGIKNYAFLTAVILIISAYYFLHYFRLPDIIFNLDLFSPGKFAQSAWFPSMGDLLLLSVICFFIVFNFYKEFILDLGVLKKSGILLTVLLILFAMLILGWFRLTTFLFESLILDSTISFETYKVLNLTIYTFFGFLILALLFATLSLLIDKVMGILKNLKRRREALIMIISMNLIVLIATFSAGKIINPESAVFFLLLTSLIYFMRILRLGNYRFSGFVSFVALFAVFTVTEVVKYTAQKNRADMKIKAVNLSAEHDPVAELLFVDLDKKIRKDTDLKEMIFAPRLDVNTILSTLQRKYFSGFWDKYELQITLCRPFDSVYIAPPDDELYPCYEFFNEILLKDGIEVPNTGFYFLDNLNGRISYLAAIPFRKDNQELTLYIDLNSRLISEGLGYPELLLDDKYNPPPSAGDYSYAKYSKGRLITFSGSFAYYMSSSIYTNGDPGWSYLRKDNYDHLIYNIDRSNTIIVSKPSVYWVDILISFSYIFSFYFVIMVLFLLITNLSPVSTKFQWNFKSKIQMAITGSLFFSLIFIGAGIVYFSIRQYQNKHVEILQEKIQSVSVS